MLVELLTIQNQIRVFHWQTKEYSVHLATDKTYEELDGKIDKFIEVFSGKYGHIYNNGGFTLKLDNVESESTITSFVDKNIEYLTNELPKAYKETDTDLSNIRDEMLATLNQLKYLLSLSS